LVPSHDPKNSTISQAVLLEGVEVKLFPPVCESDRLDVFVATILKLQQFVVNESDKVRHCRRAAIQQVCQHWL